jgi:lipopolysaccharide export system permease protein
MTRLDRLILMEIIGPFVGSAFLFTGLFFAGGDLIRFASYLQGGAGAWMVAQMIFFRFPMIIALTFPMAILLGTLLSFGRLSGDSELIALVAAGISFERVVAPVAVFGLAVSLVGLWFNESVVPDATRRGEALVTAYKARGGANLLSADAFTLPLRDGKGNLTLLHVDGGVDPATANLRNVSIEIWQDGVPANFFAAETAEWQPGTKNWRLRHGRAVSLGATSAVTAFEGLSTDEVTLDTPQELAALELPVGQVSTAQLRRRANILRAGGNLGDAREADVEIANRASLPFASLVFALIGAPLGVSPKRAGKGLGFGMSVLITFSYWMAMQVLAVVARAGYLPPFVALMLPNAVCLGLAILLSRRVFRA